ncbi:hypothetical protein BCR35DRAFT_311491 [Leucosporidium creatinivorum]|uniref:BSD domain-containing protein n=1 Tax=Leucosporidium creatinivorum TaxID=106004 RepID=A0A1Y2BX09_9BASI|nr:hypothetical protein BCR35DRAFT_311491 [Leucosporidium creatinivorum]
MDFSGGFIASPSPPISRSQSPAPASLTAPTTNAPTTSSPLAASSLPDDAPTPTAPAEAPKSPTLENELTTVMAGLGSFWGKVRKQSVTAYQSAEKQMETARKDLTPLVSKARANLDSLSETTKAEFARLSEAGASGGGVVIGADGMPIIIDDPAPAKVDKGKGVDPSERGEGGDAPATAQDGGEDATANPGAAAAAFFAKLQSQVASNPNVKGLSKNLQTLQTSVQSNLSHLPASLQTNLTQLQTQFAHIDLADTSKHAEDYLHKGEHWLAEFSNEVQRLALDAVKVVPPSEAAMSDERSKKREERLRKAEQVAVGRRDLLILNLRGDKEGLLVDPAQPPAAATTVGEAVEGAAADLREAFSRFLQAVEDRGGFEGEEWIKQVEEEVEAGGEKLAGLVKSLVPEKLTKEAFWSRYFFKVAQIDEDEQRRRKVLEVTEDNDDDFSWDMEDEEEEEEASAAAPTSTLPASTSTSALAPPPAISSTTTTSSSSTTLPPTAPDTPRATADASSSDSEPDWGLSPAVEQAPTMAAPSATAETAQTSPRASSDGTSSYDVVGAASGTPSERGDVEEGAAAAVGEKKEAKKEESDEDSDWE